MVGAFMLVVSARRVHVLNTLAPRAYAYLRLVPPDWFRASGPRSTDVEVGQGEVLQGDKARHGYTYDSMQPVL